MKFSFKFILLCTTIVHLQFMLGFSAWISGELEMETLVALNIIQGVMYLLYPWCGLVTEEYLSRTRVLKSSLVLLLIAFVLQAIIGVLVVSQTMTSRIISIGGFLLAVVVFIGLIGLGMFESNVIQFGMDQMMDASSEQLSSFIHWYFWSTHVGPLVMYYVIVGIFFFLNMCRDENVTIFSSQIQTLAMVILITSLIQSAGLIGLLICNRNLIAEQTKQTSLSLVYHVLKYSFNSFNPVRRSAFTYWENYMPSRIDLGKDKYGGPFTYEQVEDVKTFFRLLLLIISLFGFHLMGDGYSLIHYYIGMVGCPSTLHLLMTMINPQHIPNLVVLLGIPTIKILQKYFTILYRFNMLMRLQVGLFLALVTVSVQTLFGILLNHHGSNCLRAVHIDKQSSVLTWCLYADVQVKSNGSCVYLCSDPFADGYLMYAMYTPFILQGLSYSLVHLSMIEFICAQAPTSVKGLLIGLWYSMLSIKLFSVSITDGYSSLLVPNTWSVYNGAKGLGVFLSICVFSLVCHNYRYRERNKVVNEYAIIANQFERELMRETGSESEYDSDD